MFLTKTVCFYRDQSLFLQSLFLQNTRVFFLAKTRVFSGQSLFLQNTRVFFLQNTRVFCDQSLFLQNTRVFKVYRSELLCLAHCLAL